MIAEWTAATLWLATSLLGAVGMFSREGKLVMVSMVLMLTLLLAAFIFHVVVLATLNSYTRINFPGQTSVIDESPIQSIRTLIVVSNILGIAFTVMVAAFLVPTMIALATALGHKGKDKRRQRSIDNTCNSNAPVENHQEPFANKQEPVANETEV